MKMQLRPAKGYEFVNAEDLQQGAEIIGAVVSTEDDNRVVFVCFLIKKEDQTNDGIGPLLDLMEDKSRRVNSKGGGES